MTRENILKATIRNGCNNLLAAYEKEFPVPDIQVNFSTSQGLKSLNARFATFKLEGMLDGKAY